jgi:hypothetical protein
MLKNSSIQKWLVELFIAKIPSITFINEQPNEGETFH